ncbi:dystrophin-related protein 2-like [Achroia grisella]|uniref:dystrophin-related protein 2-like n=1 Tax=Achroia grisella TaxID=688607 RepID=UPI0027D34352|nr:dystrophin-related protein 2-like [Achroia grisella]
MSNITWKKIENEGGYPCYVDETSGSQQYDHPEFQKIMEALKEYDDIKYSAYKIAFKIFSLQKHLLVPPLRISSGVFARHQLSLSESSLSLDTAELEAVLADIYFAAEKEGLFSGDVDLVVDLLINLLLNVYDRDRKEPVRVLSAKTLLIILSTESATEKWAALANCCADHNGCVSPRRLAALLAHMTALPEYLGVPCDQVQADVDACFDKSAGMLGVSTRTVAEWGVANCTSARWLPAVQRVVCSRNSANVTAACAACLQPLIQVLKFKCYKCNEVYFCEKCYLYDKDLSTVSGHKKTHLVHEIVDGETKPPECLSFIKGMKRFFFCTRTRKKKISKKNPKKLDKADSTVRIKRDGKPTIFTSTVGKASGNGANNPTCMLQDIITQLETQNKALEDLSSQLQSMSKDTPDSSLKDKVEAHWHQISMQINRLKILKENLSSNIENIPPEAKKPDKIERPQAFDLFSPIPVEEKQSKLVDLKNQPRVLSMDSGNFSVVSKQADSNNLMTMSGDALKPVVVHATSDSISTVSMNDISNWYNETEPATDKRSQQSVKPVDTNQSLSATEQKYAADIRSMASSNDKMKELNADLDTVLDRLQQILTNNFAVDDSCFDNTQLRETANEMEGLLGTLIRGVEQRATLNATKGLV